MSEKLVEDVAREIADRCAIVINGCDQMPGEQIQNAARAALTVALEACEKVARGYRERMEAAAAKPHPVTGRENTVALCKSDAGKSIEEAIRALLVSATGEARG